MNHHKTMSSLWASSFLRQLYTRFELQFSLKSLAEVGRRCWVIRPKGVGRGLNQGSWHSSKVLLHQSGKKRFLNRPGFVHWRVVEAGNGPSQSDAAKLETHRSSKVSLYAELRLKMCYFSACPWSWIEWRTMQHSGCLLFPCLFTL